MRDQNGYLAYQSRRAALRSVLLHCYSSWRPVPSRFPAYTPILPPLNFADRISAVGAVNGFHLKSRRADHLSGERDLGVAEHIGISGIGVPVDIGEARFGYQPQGALDTFVLPAFIVGPLPDSNARAHCYHSFLALDALAPNALLVDKASAVPLVVASGTADIPTILCHLTRCGAGQRHFGWPGVMSRSACKPAMRSAQTPDRRRTFVQSVHRPAR